jgi:hypothetical protein
MGQNRDPEWHVYANPHNPEICPVFSFACFISNPGAFSDSKDEITSEQDKDWEDGVDVTVQRGNSPSPTCHNKECLFLGHYKYDRFMSCHHWNVSG